MAEGMDSIFSSLSVFVLFLVPLHAASFTIDSERLVPAKTLQGWKMFVVLNLRDTRRYDAARLDGFREVLHQAVWTEGGVCVVFECSCTSEN